jgi:hypothetical protein
MIAEHHLQMLAASGITPEAAGLRCYETISAADKRRLSEVRITPAGRRIPGLLIPLLDIRGSVWGYQYRPDSPRLRSGKPVKYETPTDQRNGLDVPPGVGAQLGNPAVPMFVTEGTKKADCAAVHGLCCVALMGVWSWRGTNTAGGKVALADWQDVALNGRKIIIAYDGDVQRKEPVRAAMGALSKYLAIKGAKIEYLHLPDTGTDKIGLDDFLVEHAVDELWKLVQPIAPRPRDPRDDIPKKPPTSPKPNPVQPVPLDYLHERFLYWFGEHYDLDAIDAGLAAAAVERLDGDPLWLLIVAGPGAAKTETIVPIGGCAGATVESTISSLGALLSATSTRERAKDATGGLLRKLGPRGIIVLKDVTSILSLNSGVRAEILAALREIYDGYWSRNVGTDGGRTLDWRGRLVVIGAVTTEWDRHHAVITSMGDRFVLLRIDSARNRIASGRRTIENTGHENEMRGELTRLAAGVIAGIDGSTAPELTADEQGAILTAADLVTLARTAVDVDYRGNVINAHAPELPTRFARQLTQLLRGAVAIGLDRAEALRLAIRCARDSMPPLRLDIMTDLAANPHSTPTDVRRRLNKPRATADRQLQALHILGLVTLDEVEVFAAFGKVQTQWHYALADDVDPAVLDPDTVTRKITTRTYTHKEGKGEGADLDAGDHTPTDFSGNDDRTIDRAPCQPDRTPTDFSGNDQRAIGGADTPHLHDTCLGCGRELTGHWDLPAVRLRGYCSTCWYKQQRRIG